MLAHFTQKRLAEESGVSLDLIIDFENGERRCREVTLGQMEKIAKVLGKELTIDPLPNYETSATTLGMLLYHARKERKPLRAIFDEL